MTVESTCPKCQKEVNYDQWCEDFPCPHCKVMLSHCHDCYYLDDPPDSYCCDWLEVVED